MAEPYLSDLQDIVDRLCSPTKGVRISCRHFFSGAAAYVEDRIFMTLTPVGLALKLSDNDCGTLFDQGAKPLRYFTRAPVKNGYAVVPNAMIFDEESLRGWVARSMGFVRRSARSSKNTHRPIRA